MIATLGALANGTLVIYHEDKPSGWAAQCEAASIDSIARLFEYMDGNSITTLHLHRSALQWLDLPQALDVPKRGQRRPAHPWVADARVAGERVSQRALSPSITTRDKSLEILIGAYQDSYDPWQRCADAKQLLDALCAFANAFPRRWEWRHSAMVTGWNLMHASAQTAARRRGERADQLREQLDAGVQLPPVLEDAGQIELPFGAWKGSELGDVASVYPLVQAWDVNGQRLAACSRLPLGVGPYRMVPPSTDFKRPGYHHVAEVVQRPRHAFDPNIPSLIEAGRWYTSARLAMAKYCGLAFTISESWQATDYVSYLDGWYQQLRDARRQLLTALAIGKPEHFEAVRAALDALKQCYLQPLGRLRSGRARQAGDKLYRPDWYDSVIGNEIGRQYLRLHQLADMHVPVVAVYFDLIVCAVHELDAPPLPIEVSDQLGKYKSAGAMPMLRAAEILKDGSVGELVKALKHGDEPAMHPPTGAQRQTVEQGRVNKQPRVTQGPRLGRFARPVHGGYPDAS